MVVLHREPEALNEWPDVLARWDRLGGFGKGSRAEPRAFLRGLAKSSSFRSGVLLPARLSVFEQFEDMVKVPGVMGTARGTTKATKD